VSQAKTLQNLRSLIERDLGKARLRRDDAAKEYAKADAAIQAYLEGISHCDAAIVAAEKEEAKKGQAR
jgi:hypothetical protein